MQFDEMGFKDGKMLFLLPGTACDFKNEYYTDLLTHLQDDIHVEHTKVHFIYAKKMDRRSSFRRGSPTFLFHRNMLGI